MLLLDAPGSAPNGICLLAQQAAEKALKAAIVAQEAPVPRTHNLWELRALIVGGMSGEPEGLALRELTDWYLAARYPGDWTEPTREDAVASLATAEMIVGAVVARLSVFKDPA